MKSIIPPRDWRQLAAALQVETDTEKILQLAEELKEALARQTAESSRDQSESDRSPARVGGAQRS